MPSFVELILKHRRDWERILLNALMPTVSDEIRRAYRRMIRQAEGLGIQGAFDINNPKVQEWMLEYGAQRVVNITDTSEKQIRRVIAEGTEQGQTIREIATNLLDDPIIGEVATAYRAQMIARTETANAYLNGTRLGCIETNAMAQNAGMPQPYTHLVFIASPLCCDICQELDRQIRWAMDETIELPHPQCRWSVEPELSSSYLE